MTVKPKQSPEWLASHERVLALLNEWARNQRRNYWRLTKMPMDRLRLAELERLYAFRWGAVLPDDDAGVDDLEVALHHLANGGGKNVIERMTGWCARWAPWLPEAKALELCERIAADPEKYSADEIGERMRLCILDRERLEIRTIGAFNMPKILMVGAKPYPLLKEYQRHLKNRKRSKQTRAEYLAKSLSRSKPWEAEGISQRTWERRRAKP
jgi:hypothetical protein